MSSFNYTDDFSGFNDLINRADFLTEARTSKIGKSHPSFPGLAGRLEKEVEKGFQSDVRQFIARVLYYIDIFTDEDMDRLKGAGGAAYPAYRGTLEELLDGHKDEIQKRAGEVADGVEKEFVTMVNDQKLRVGVDRMSEYRAKREAAKTKKQIEKEIKGGGDIIDVVDGAKDDIEQVMSLGVKQGFESLAVSKADPTTFIEIKIRDADRAEDVSKIVTKYANEDGVEVSGDTVQFSVDPETPLAKAVSAHGIDKIEAALKRDVDKISDSVVVVMAPDEDYEEDMYGTEGDGSYAAQENEVNEPIDENEEGDKWIQGAVKDMKEKGTEGALTRAAKAAGESMSEYCASPPSKLGKRRCQFRANVSDEEDDEFGGLELDHFLTKEQPEDYIPSTDYEDVLNDLVNKDKKDHALKKLNGDSKSEEHEEYRHSPMLDSYQTSTAGYITEQAASDNRNKKSEVKNQSFKEKYKPKTKWQLEELKRYGL